MVRVLSERDRAALEAFLAPLADSSMFLLANSRKGGLVDEGLPFQATYAGAFDSERIVRSLDAPVWVAHGERDMIVPARMGRAVYDAAKKKGRLLILPGASHNDVEDVGGEEYWQWLEGAVR